MIKKKENFEAKKTLKKSKIILQLDSYDDIFSDFDPRPYDKRALSDDFIQETKRATRDYGDQLELRFLMPAEMRDSKDEKIIIKRLKEHFHKHALRYKKEISNTLNKGVICSMIGFSLMISGAYFATFYNHVLFQFVKVLFEPIGWFTMWYGLDLIFYAAKKSNSDLTFNEKLTKADIVFQSY